MFYCGVLWGTAGYCWVLLGTAGYCWVLGGTGCMMWEVGVMVGGNESTVGKLVGNVGTGAAGWY